MGVLALLSRIKGFLYVLIVLVVYMSQNGTSLSFRPTCRSKYMILSGHSLENGSVEQNCPVGDAELDAPLDVGSPLGFQGTLLFGAGITANQHPQISSCRAALQPLLSLFVLVPSVTSSQVQKLIFGLVNYHTINDCSRLQSV